MVIRILGRFPEMSAGQLAQVLHTHPSTVTGLVRRLERKNLVTRKEDASDRRRLRLELTADGHKIDVDTGGTIEAAITRVLRAQKGGSPRLVRRMLVQLTTTLQESVG